MAARMCELLNSYNRSSHLYILHPELSYFYSTIFVNVFFFNEFVTFLFRMDETEVNIKDLNDLTDRLADVREETSRYSQLSTAQENLKHLFTVPETVKNTEAAIVEGKLLDAHKSLSELEQSRDDLVSWIGILNCHYHTVPAVNGQPSK